MPYILFGNFHQTLQSFGIRQAFISILKLIQSFVLTVKFRSGDIDLYHKSAKFSEIRKYKRRFRLI